jgi:Na+/H+ antiporter NhaD/arsenite permease-like protein
LTVVTALISWYVGLNYAQIGAVSIFALEIYAIILFWKFRLPFAFIAIFILMILNLLDVFHLIEFASFDVILFLIGMMTIIGFLEENHFFEYLIDQIITIVGNRTDKLILVFLVASAVFAALVDEVTSILFMSSTMFYLTSTYQVNPLPFIIMMVFATNIGSSATAGGNPVGVIIALKGGLSFSDFIRWATPISIVALVATIYISTKIFSKDMKELNEKLQAAKVSSWEEKKAYSEKKIRLCWVIFILTIATLVLHHSIEELFHLERNTMLIGTAFLYGGVSLLLERHKAQEIIERRIDWWTLLFFALLFASVGTLKYVGVTKILAQKVYNLAEGSELGVFVSFTWIAAVLSAFLDNVLAVSIFTPVVQDLSDLGVYTFPLWWGMLFAGTFFGNLTMLGSTANIIAIGMLERRRDIHITFMQWLKYGILVAVPTLILATLLLFLQFPYMPR